MSFVMNSVIYLGQIVLFSYWEAELPRRGVPSIGVLRTTGRWERGNQIPGNARNTSHCTQIHGAFFIILPYYHLSVLKGFSGKPFTSNKLGISAFVKQYRTATGCLTFDEKTSMSPFLFRIAFAG